MAIQLPNAGLGDGQTGDNEFVMWTKVKNNFSDTTNAASKLVGATAGRVPLAEQSPQASFNLYPSGTVTEIDPDAFQNLPSGIHYIGGSADVSKMPYAYNNVLSFNGYNNTRLQIYYGYTSSQNNLYYRTKPFSGGSFPDVSYKIYSTANTTIDAGTGFLKASSPVLHVYNDKIDKIHEAEQLDITVDKKGVGHYEIHGTTGLRQDDGWNMSPPRDIHGNVRCMIEVTEKDGVITVKTYKRKFDLELAAIVHDYDNPLDIPDGACVELRFNDLPYDNLDDTQMEV